MGGRYKAYPEYKDTSGHWVGEIPKHWTATHLKRICSLTTGITPSTENHSNFSDDPSEFPWVGPEDLDESGNSVTARKYLSELGWQRVRQIEENSVLICCIGTIGKIGFASAKVSTNQQITAATFKKAARFNYYLLKAAKEILEISATGNVLRILNSERLGGVRFIAVPDSESETIANFLDHETAKIGTLIEKQQQLIQLLKEKRQAVISHAVTKGLNPNAKMRDSGVEWLGEVPKHWVVAQLKFYTLEMQTGPFGSQLHAEDYIDDGIPLINPAHMQDGRIIPDPQVSVDQKTWLRLSRHQLYEGDLIFARRGELGRCAVVTKHQEGWLCGTGSLKAKLNDRLLSEYSYLLITSQGVVSELSLESKGSTMDNLNTETLGRVRLPVPPTSEQKLILEFVHQAAGHYGKLIEKAFAAIGLMQERRTALISAAVTGKIDVRDWVLPTPDHRSEEAA